MRLAVAYRHRNDMATSCHCRIQTVVDNSSDDNDDGAAQLTSWIGERKGEKLGEAVLSVREGDVAGVAIWRAVGGPARPERTGQEASQAAPGSWRPAAGQPRVVCYSLLPLRLAAPVLKVVRRHRSRTFAVLPHSPFVSSPTLLSAVGTLDPTVFFLIILILSLV